jgi:hypothetical protein
MIIKVERQALIYDRLRELKIHNRSVASEPTPETNIRANQH